MWREILMENRPAVLSAGRDLQRKLADLLEFLEKLEDLSLLKFLEEAKRLRDQRYS
jgi:prephenate dehydrogenase